MTVRVFEFDDFPRVREHTLAVFDDLHRRFPNFRVTMFGIPTEMTDADFAEIEKRRPWMRLGLHGFYHDKAECREPTTWRQYMPMLDAIRKDERWDRIFKPPWHGLDPDMAIELAERDFIIAIKTIPFFPYPMPDFIECSCIHDFWWANGCGPGIAVESHPCYDNPHYFKAAETEISKRNLKVMTTGWTEDDQFVFSEDISRPLCLKINIGCGKQDWPGWACLDNKPWHANVITHDMLTCRLPYGSCKADAIAMSHALAHVPVEQFKPFFADVFRVLRPGAVFRFAETDCSKGYIWRRIGEPARGNGPIVSEPTKVQVIEAMQAAGFAVVEAKPGETLSPHKDILQMDGRLRRWERGQHFCIEAVKAVAITDITRSSRRRPAVPRDLRALYERNRDD